MQDAQILLCDPTGISTAAALMAAYFIVQKQYRLEHILEACSIARPKIAVSLSLRRGLDQLQRSLDEKKMKRYNAKVRNSVAMSVGF